MKILFVCLGNICRSPIAEGIAKKIAQSHGVQIVADSAGTGDYHVGEPPCEHSVKIAKMNGIDISSYRARQVKKEDFENFDLIVALDEQNRRDLKRMGAEDVVKLGEFGYDSEDVPDPYFFDGFDGFEKVYDMIESCVANLFEVYDIIPSAKTVETR
ncbi:low molecular weight protein-tyrosine-phosphatase [Nitrosophilus alvini]|uniref:low molecular weight protein-tyrosine-phosphatase n=1 Tax=Nitrosophilus alvini TaxID=2714855 RepID=UPI00190C363C|nr:low molecular weight protein-tyrosine-phosphatase [Nitrosophilus alvini]